SFSVPLSATTPFPFTSLFRSFLIHDTTPNRLLFFYMQFLFINPHKFLFFSSFLPYHDGLAIYLVGKGLIDKKLLQNLIQLFVTDLYIDRIGFLKQSLRIEKVVSCLCFELFKDNFKRAISMPQRYFLRKRTRTNLHESNQ